MAMARVLVVEDEVLVAMGLEALLLSAGYDVVGPVGQLEKAVLTAEHENIDCALLDINIRGKEVYPVADALRARGVPIIFLSGYGESAVHSAYRENAILTKPCPPDMVLRKINRVMDNHAASKP